MHAGSKPRCPSQYCGHADADTVTICFPKTTTSRSDPQIPRRTAAVYPRPVTQLSVPAAINKIAEGTETRATIAFAALVGPPPPKQRFESTMRNAQNRSYYTVRSPATYLGQKIDARAHGLRRGGMWQVLGHRQGGPGPLRLPPSPAPHSHQSIKNHIIYHAKRRMVAYCFQAFSHFRGRSEFDSSHTHVHGRAARACFSPYGYAVNVYCSYGIFI